MADWWTTPVEFLKGVGPQKADLLKKELGLFTYGDLLQYFPFRYVDKSKFWSIREITDDMPYVQLKGYLSDVRKTGFGKSQRAHAIFSDGTGQLELVWFQGIKWIENAFLPNTEYVIFGKPTRFKQHYSLAHPEVNKASEASLGPPLMPVYQVTEKMKPRGMDSRFLARLIRTLVNAPDFFVEENLPDHVLQQYHFLSRTEAYRHMHYPKQMEQVTEATNRLRYEELFFTQIRLLGIRNKRRSLSVGQPFLSVGELFNRFYQHHLPFELTNAQKRVVKELHADLKSGKQMNRLLQGDVGSGKTVVALLCMLLAADNGFQSCLMAPTEILAQQHFQTISTLLQDIPVRVGLLTGSTSAAERKNQLLALENGHLHMLIGTHALIEEDVQFRRLGLAIIDEQHRFGVAQRARLWKRDAIPAHVLVMTATPIPRTLAMTFYGDLDYSVIDELPAGRKPIKTVHRKNDRMPEIYAFMRDEIAKGRQVYVVYPLIEESEKLDLANLTEGFEEIKEAFPEPSFVVSMVHGRMKTAEKDAQMARFISGESQIMVATTVIEVGVNVPNASVMVIRSAERFGLAQLHQLRGRVGRGADQSYCILVTGHKLSTDTRKRLQTMVDTTDGFKIAQVDLELRGPGDMDGTRQSGVLELRLTDLSRDRDWIEKSRRDAETLLLNDPRLTLPEHLKIRQHLQKTRSGKAWAEIS